MGGYPDKKKRKKPGAVAGTADRSGSFLDYVIYKNYSYKGYIYIYNLSITLRSVTPLIYSQAYISRTCNYTYIYVICLYI